MKKFLFAFMAFTLLASVCCQDESSTEKEKKAVIAVIEEEKEAYFKKDLTGLDNTWSQESTDRKLFMAPNGITELDGWTKIHQNNVEASEREWDESLEPPRYSNYAITLYGNTALVLHDSEHQMNSVDEESTLEMRRILHMVKLEGEWKIDFMAMYFLPHVVVGEEIDE